MKTPLPLLPVLPLLVVAGGCTQSEVSFGPARDYGFVHHETTGITAAVVDGAAEVPVLFSSDSSPDALASFRRLKASVLLPSADGRHLVVTGSLARETARTQAAPDRAAPEAYREFRLDAWHLVAPFLERKDASAPLVTRSSLRADDFEDLAPNVDVNRFVKAE